MQKRRRRNVSGPFSLFAYFKGRWCWCFNFERLEACVMATAAVRWVEGWLLWPRGICRRACFVNISAVTAAARVKVGGKVFCVNEYFVKQSQECTSSSRKDFDRIICFARISLLRPWQPLLNLHKSSQTTNNNWILNWLKTRATHINKRSRMVVFYLKLKA